MNWLKEHRLFSVIAGIVLVLCLVIIVSFLSAGGSSFIGRGTHRMISVAEKPLSYITSGVRNTVAGIFRYNSVKDENVVLKKRIAELEAENTELILKKSELSQLRNLSGAFDSEAYKRNKDLVAANIIELDYSNGNGLVGKVIEAGNGYAKVVSILSDNNNVSFRVLKRQKVSGVLSANKNGELEGYVLKNKYRIVKGDTLITSGIGIYPKGIKIGKVKSVDYDDDRQLKVVKVKPAVDFETMEKVAIFK